jgi:hypothetical protein
MEYRALKVVYALVFVLFTTAASAQTLDNNAGMMVAYDFDGYSVEITEQSTIPTQIVPTEPPIENLGDTYDEALAFAEPHNAADAPVGAIQPSDESSALGYQTPQIDVDHASAQGTASGHIIDTEAEIASLGEAPKAADMAVAEPM